MSVVPTRKLVKRTVERSASRPAKLMVSITFSEIAAEAAAV